MSKMSSSSKDSRKHLKRTEQYVRKARKWERFGTFEDQETVWLQK